MCKLRPLLEKWLEEAENLQEVCKEETLVQPHKKKQRSIENCMREPGEHVSAMPESYPAAASSPNISGCRRMWSYCGSITSTIRAGDQTLTVPNERSRRLQGLLSQRSYILSSATRGPFWCPRLQEPLLLRSLLLRMKPFPRFLSLLWFLPRHQTEAPTLCRDGVNRGKGKEVDRENVESVLPWP